VRVRKAARLSGPFWVLVWLGCTGTLTLAEDAADWLSIAQSRIASLRTNTPARASEIQPQSLADQSAEELRRHFQDRREASTARRELRAWELVAQLAQRRRMAPDPLRQAELDLAIREIASAVTLEREPPVPEEIDVAWGAFNFWNYALNPVGRGTRPAENLAGGVADDLSSRQPLPSTFWTPPLDLPAKDLHAGFGRRKIPEFDDVVWDYHEPKTSSGAHPGFTVRSAGRELKVKFGETHSEPFAARIVDALGYHVSVSDFAPQLRVRYDRRLFREFHQRQDLTTRLKFLGLFTVYTLHYQDRYDPFSFVTGAVLKDGTSLTSSELRRRLLPTANPVKHPEDEPSNFDHAFEQQVDYVTLGPANVEEDTPSSGRAVGRWSFEALGHQDRRELRGLGLLAGWLCWFDSRTINTRLRVEADESEAPRLIHSLTDLGGSLGRSRGFMLATVQDPEDFGWRFTRPQRIQGPGRMTIPFRIVDYQPIA
jgi:hypothetical protein